MGLFTFVLEYAGGTYVSQKAGADEQEAFSNWIGSLSTSKIPDAELLGTAFAEATQDLTAIEILDGVWCDHVLARDELALVNVIRTAPRAND